MANRRCFDEYLQMQWQNLAQQHAPISLILLDIDFFKLYNDYYGHLAGDECLHRVATVLSPVAKKNTDLVARYGGEEFAIIMPDTQPARAVYIAQVMQTEVSAIAIPHAHSHISPHVTLSFGVATTIPRLESSPSSLIVAADKALYQAKAEGRNRIILKQVHC